NLVAHFEYESLDIPKLVVPPAAVQPDPRLYADIVSKDIEQLTHVGQQIYDCIHAALKQLEKSATKEQQSKIRECSATQQAERATFFQQLTSLKGETNPLCCNRYKRKLLDNVKSWQLKLEKMAEEQQPPSKDNSPLQSVTNSPKEAIRYNNEESFSAFSALSSAILSSSSQNNPHFVNTSSLTLGTSPSATSSSPSTTPSPSAPSSASVSAASSRNASPIHSPATTPRLIGAVAGRRQAALDLQMNGSPMCPSILPPSSEEEEAQEESSAILSFPSDSHKNPLNKRAEQQLLPSLSTSPTSSKDEPKNTSNNNTDSSKSTTTTSISVPVPTILTTTSVIPRSISPAIPAAITNNNALALELTQLQPFALSPPESFVTPWQPSSYSISTTSSSRFNRKEEGLNNRHRRDSSTSILITHQNNGNNNFNSNNNTGGSVPSSITLSTAIPGSPSQTRQHTISAGSGSGIGGFKGLEPPRQIGGGVATSGGSSKGFLRHSISALLPNSPAPSLSFISDIGALAHKIVPGFLLPEGHNNTTIIINKEEPSSIIAHTLCSHEYRRELFHSIYNTVERKRDEQVSEELMLRADLVSTDKTHIKNKFTHTDSSGQKLEKFFCMSYFAKQFHALRALYCTPLSPQEDEEEEEQSDSEIEGEREQEVSEQEDNQSKKRTTKEHKNQNGMSESQQNGNRNAKKVGDATKKQSKQKQRKIQYPHDDEFFIQSLSRCKPWAAQGGKSGSAFSKTVDERFILKQISVIEVRSFLEFGPLYFQYLARSMFQKIPTALVKILGLYCIQWKAESGKPIKQHIVVMENLFYDKNVTKSFDLKGSLRSRYVASNPTLPRQVLMDENLLESLYASPICINEKSKIMLSMAVWNDSLFLSELGIMDYSLLIGLDESTHELVVGVIDYMRKYTWDKQLETWVKWSGIMGGGRGKVPTVISPKQYKTRFRAAMWLYFVMIPDEELDGNRIEDLDSFYDEVARQLLSPGISWGRNLSALDDILRGGFGTPEGTVWRIRWVNSQRSRQQLGHAALARWLEQGLTRVHPSNRKLWEERLAEARAGRGETLFDKLVEVIRDHAPRSLEASDEGVLLELA
ncbi:1-phosphatidylinositol-3-phosphate 5-kinase, partial [Balamuthia mandrillaris]